MNYIFLLLFGMISLTASQQIISEYKVHHETVFYDNQLHTKLRSMTINNEPFYLLVNNTSLHTILLQKTALETAVKQETNSNYDKLLSKYKQPALGFQNYGAKHIAKSEKVYLTIDMCPSSKKGFEEKFIKALAQKYKKDLTLTIFISGDWIKHHAQEFELLKAWQKDINIIWGNHTMHHPYFKGKALHENFLLSKNVNIHKEILDNEKLLLSYGITPSILFRFPGLVSNNQANDIVNSLGLIPVGSSAWLAKEEPIEKGSIILIHGNKNEPYGIQKAAKAFFEEPSYSFGSLLEDLY